MKRLFRWCLLAMGTVVGSYPVSIAEGETDVYKVSSESAYLRELKSKDIWIHVKSVNGRRVHRSEQSDAATLLPSGSLYVGLEYYYWRGTASGYLHDISFVAKPGEHYYIACEERKQTLYVWIEEGSTGKAVTYKLVLWPWAYIPSQEGELDG